MRHWFYSFIIASLLLSLTFTSTSASSQWYETQGHASIDDDDIAVARNKAVENALKKALLVAGASVSSVQQVINGLLTQDQISIRASGSVNAIELVDELHSGNLITVTIRADIFPQEKKCFAVNFKKSLLLTKSHLVNREQANIGKIYPIDTAIIKKLEKHLTADSNFTYSRSIFNSKTEFSRLNNSLEGERIKDLVRSLGGSTDSQYILFSEINDLSFEDQATNSWQFWQQGIYPRTLSLSFYLYSGFSGDLVWQKDYQDTAIWSFTKRKTIDVNSIIFWQSEYGSMINNMLTQVTKDIDENVMCEPSKGKILQVNGNKITFNLGRDHGVKIGDEFTLLHAKDFNSNEGKRYSGFNISPYKVKVTQLTRGTAIAHTPDNSLFGNIQINDFAVRY
ncbi:flagellar assembly protein FlgT [Colwellia asteriadis]|uniref:Flagellar assembly protein FlgT n=1 Tax=Colwellia asteriadis TaxID=517723 RepID=A0ABP3WJK7_9GAMM